MRFRLYAIIQLLVMVFYIGRPVIPFVQYAVYKDYIVKNLCVNKDKPNSCCQGKCYLAKEARKASQTTDSEDRNNNRKVHNNELNEFLISRTTVPGTIEKRLLRRPGSGTDILTGSLSAIFIPPRMNSIL